MREEALECPFKLKKGEKVIIKTNCSHIKGIESVGGKLYVTTKRLYFKSHRFNIQNHSCEIAIKDIKSVYKGKYHPFLFGVGMIVEIQEQSKELVRERLSPLKRAKTIEEIELLISKN